MLADETGYVGTERDDSQVIGASEIERNSCQSCRQALAFHWLRHFGVVKDDTIRKPAIGNQRTKAINKQFEAPGLFVVGDGYVLEIRVHESPRALGDLFGFLHEDLSVTVKVYQGTLQN